MKMAKEMVPVSGTPSVGTYRSHTRANNVLRALGGKLLAKRAVVGP
jgi:hypothetical protein